MNTNPSTCAQFRILALTATLCFLLAPLASQAQASEKPSSGLYVALGDSITAGTGVARSCRPFPQNPVDIDMYCPDGTSYAILTAERLRTAGIAGRFMNLGIPGANVARVIKDELPYIPADATLITLYIGTNDSRQFEPAAPPPTDVIQQFEQLYDQLLLGIHKQAPKARVVLINIPNEKVIGETYRLSTATEERFDLISQSMDRFINSHYPLYEVVDTVCDPNSYIVAHRDKGSVHPNEAGAADLAKAVIDVLLSSKPLPPPDRCQWFRAVPE